MEKIEILRVKYDAKFYCDIIPSAADPKISEFWLHSAESGNAMLMFGCEVETDETAIRLAENNLDKYISIFKNEIEW